MIDAGLLDLGAPDFSAERFDIRMVNAATAQRWIGEFHYSGVAPAGGTYYGVFAPDLACVVGIGPTANVFGVERIYELERWPGNLEVIRVAKHPEASHIPTSRMVRLVLDRVAATGIDWLFSYADVGQDHHGGIYQALGAVYVGCRDARPGYLVNGEVTHPRTVVARYGTQGAGVFDIAAERGDHVERVADLVTPKHTYLLVIARDRTVRRAIMAHLLPWKQAYPKRAAAAPSGASVYQIDADGSQPIPPLQTTDPYDDGWLAGDTPPDGSLWSWAGSNGGTAQ